MTTQHFDVAIIGGGPSGVSTLLHLHQAAPHIAGRTLVLEKYKHPREKYCAGAVSSVGLEALAKVGYTLDVPSVRIEGVRLRYGKTSAEHQRPGIGVVIRRSEFDASLWEYAKRTTAATMHDGEKLVALERAPKGFSIRTDAGTYTASVVVGADGTGSAVRKLMGFKETRRKGHLYVLETEPTANENPETEIIDFDLSCVAEGIQGYYWDFPTPIGGRKYVSRGIYHANRVPRSDLKRVLAQFLARRGIDPEKVTYKSYSERGFDPRASFTQDGLMLVGEAVGIDPVTGEGIAQGVVYGAIAGPHLARALQQSSGDFRAYEAQVRSTVMGRHLAQSSHLEPRVYGARAKQWASFLVSTPAAVAAGAQWYEGRALSKGQILSLGAGLAFAFAQGKELPAPE